MIKIFLKIAWRNLIRNKAYSSINILGLSVGLMVVILIGLWIQDELSYDKYHSNYSRLAQVKSTQTHNGDVRTTPAVVIPLATELREKYRNDFQAVALSSWNEDYLIAFDNKKLFHGGSWVEPPFPRMFGLKMLHGDVDALKDPSAVLLSESLAKALFGNIDPVGKNVKIMNDFLLTVTGVYEDLPKNTALHGVQFLGAWQKYVDINPWVKNAVNDWEHTSFQLFVQLSPAADAKKISDKIKGLAMQHLNESETGKYEFLIHPMSQWRLYAEFRNGKNVGGRIQFVWLFGIIGVFILLLACINFMNLSTSRSEKRAKEVGIRKTIGSERKQLIGQFLSESVLIAFLSLFIAIFLVQFSLSWFNQLADKEMNILWTNPVFWAACIGFTLLTGLMAGSYPAFYLSSFNPVRVLKGTFRAGRFAALPRKILVVMQFSVSVILIIGTIVVFRQIKHAQNRPVGYSREGVLQVMMNTKDLHGHYDAMRNDLIKTGIADNMSEASSPVTMLASVRTTYNWKGKDPSMAPIIGTIAVTHDFGNTIGWQVTAGRDFSRAFSTDSGSIIINETTARLTGFKQPVGETIHYNGNNYTIIGVVKDLLVESPYMPVRPTIYYLDYNWANVVLVKIKPGIALQAAIPEIEKVFKQYNPGSPFLYKFVDEEHNIKFQQEVQVSKLSSFFAALAIFISCLGIFGLASFVAEQRTKEIGVRKVLGASVINLWGMLSKEFLQLVFIAFIIAIPVSWFSMNEWLQNYEYHTTLAWWIFAISCSGALLVTLITVSFQTIKAALSNPIRSLRSE